MSDNRTKALAWVNATFPDAPPVDDETLLVCRTTDEAMVIVVDRGIAGCPKYIVPLNDLPQPQEKAEPAPKVAAKKKASLKASKK